MKLKSIAAALLLLAGVPAASFAGDSASTFAPDTYSAEVGTGNSTQIARVGAQWKWGQNWRWWESNGTHIGGYWDLSYAYWRGNRFNNTDASQHINDFGITPVFRFQRDSLTGPYAEAGIGAHYLDDLYSNAGRRLSTRFEFGDHIGFGYVFQNKLDLGIRLQHFSNGGIKEPNNGVNYAVLRVAYPF